jgi:thiol-disulfide isomerase/thioredoxin
VDNGSLRKIASATPDIDGRFYFAFKSAAPTFYVIGLEDVLPINNYTFWFEPGDRLEMTVERDSYVLTGVNTPENEEITRWHNWVKPLEIISLYRNIAGNVTFEDFFPLLEDKLSEGYTPQYTSNVEFNAAFDHYRKSYMATLASNLLLTPRSKQPGSNDMIDYYRELELSSLATSRMLGYPYGIRLLTIYPTFYMVVNRDGLSPEKLRETLGAGAATDFIIAQLRDDRLVGEYVLYNAENIKTYEGYTEFDNKYSRYFVNEDQRERFKRLLKDIPVPDGSPAVDFSFPDTNGNQVALSDFKGKVVYIDVWATWCGPCKQQIPYLKELETEYHGNPDMVFMSVSIDADRDHQKWLDMVATENLGGVQLFGGGKSNAIQTPYKITGIPHFILVGKDGNIVDDNAPRPSSSELRAILNAALAR